MANTTYTRGSGASQGMELMRRISSGELKKAPTDQIEKIKIEIADNCEELIEVGARIRPLLVEGKQVGWVRGVHLQERRILKRWVRDPNDYVAQTLQMATSFSKEEIEVMQIEEVKALADVVRTMGEYDLSLYPYLSAYVTSQSSETLWYGKGESLTSFDHKVVIMPDGKKITIMAPPDHSRLWATLCNYREQAKKRLEENMNALFIVRPWAGKHADPIANELRAVAKQLETGSNYMWEQIVTVPKNVDVNDGWGHPGDSLEDLQRELKGMIGGDKHERMMEAWQRQMVAEEEAKQKALTEARKKRGITEAGVKQNRIEILTTQQVRARQDALKKGQKPPTPTTPAGVRRGQEEDTASRQLDKLRKYR